MRIVLSAFAQEDLDLLALYCWSEYPQERASVYLEHVYDAIAALGGFPGLGHPVSGDVRRWRYERHLIFYRVRGNEVHVERVLHERRLPPRVL